MLHSVHFTLKQANDMLEKLKPMLEEMSVLKKSLNAQKYDVFKHEYFGGMGPNGTGKFPPEMEKLVEIVKTISSKGILIKGLDNSLIDFPHLRKNGEEVYLCWMLGEDEIKFWHRIEDGFQGRKGIEEL